MEIADFVFHRPATLAEAAEIGRAHGKNARFLAGGTDLLPDLKQHRDATQHIVSLDALPGLKEIRLDGGTLCIGGLAILSDVAESALVRRHFPALAEAIEMMAALQIRNRGTLGGNFCAGVPSADTPPICIAGGAEVRIAGQGGARSVPAARFFLGPRRTVLSPGEILVEIRIPQQPVHSGASYQRFALRLATALAVAGVAARVDLDGDRIRDARVVLGATAPVPMLARSCGELLRGEKPSQEIFARAAAEAAIEAQPITDLRGSAEFRRELVGVLAARALGEAASRARRAPSRD